MRTLTLVLGTSGITVRCCELSFYELCECPPLANAGLFWKSTPEQMDPRHWEAEARGRGLRRGAKVILDIPLRFRGA